jgi:glyoxylase-like metal-dependent hydrolase (beta-lactamase superfamily II)
MQIGDYRVEVIPDCEFKLDGGAMFGVVPRVLWERVCQPDEQNRVTLTCNCLFIDTGSKKILIETGMGHKWTPKQMSMYGIMRKKPLAETLFDITGCRGDEIDIVINTHLHFDHAGGNTTGAQASRLSRRVFDGGDAADSPFVETNERSSASLRPLAGETPALQSQFPNARYLVSKSEFAAAESSHERDRASYLPENWHPLIASQQLDLMPDRYEPVAGLVVEQVRGHSETMQTIKLTRGGETLFGFFDMVPTRHHLAYPWIMSYDLYPTDTLDFKKRILPQAVEENWICHFYHDVEMPLCRLVEVDGKIVAGAEQAETRPVGSVPRGALGS